MSRSYIAVNPKSSVHLVLWSVCLCTIHRVERTICQCTSSGPPRMSALKDKNVCSVQKSNFSKMPFG
jgi:hypothetical protein